MHLSMQATHRGEDLQAIWTRIRTSRRMDTFSFGFHLHRRRGDGPYRVHDAMNRGGSGSEGDAVVRGNGNSNSTLKVKGEGDDLFGDSHTA